MRSWMHTQPYDVGGELVVYFGMDRYAQNGDSQVGFWFMQDTVYPNAAPDHTWTGVHEIGDILVLSAFTKGGTIPNIEAYMWVGERRI